MRSILVYLLLAIFCACENSVTHSRYDYGDEFELSFDEEVRIGMEKISVKFVDVLEDSRCPSNVTCVWAGNGKVQLRIEYQDLTLNTYLEPKLAKVADIDVQLLQLAPYPEHPRQFEKYDYNVRLLITKK